MIGEERGDVRPAPDRRAADLARRAGWCASPGPRRRGRPAGMTAAARRRCGRTPASGSGSSAPATCRSRSESKTETPTRPCRECRAGCRRPAACGGSSARAHAGLRTVRGRTPSTVAPPTAPPRQPSARVEKMLGIEAAAVADLGRRERRRSPSPAFRWRVGGQCLARHQPAGADRAEHFEIRRRTRPPPRALRPRPDSSVAVSSAASPLQRPRFADRSAGRSRRLDRAPPGSRRSRRTARRRRLAPVARELAADQIVRPGCRWCLRRSRAMRASRRCCAAPVSSI